MALAIDDSRPFLWLGLGDSLQRSSAFAEAEAAFKTVLGLDPEDAALWCDPPTVQDVRAGGETDPVPRGHFGKGRRSVEHGWRRFGKGRRSVEHGWRRILGAVRSYADLEPALLGRVEELIDFTTAAP